MMHFFRTFSVMRAQGVRVIAIEKVRNYEKIVYIKIFENGWKEDAYPLSYPLDPPLAISYRNHQKSQAYFSHLALLALFFFTKRRSQKGGVWPIASLKYATDRTPPYNVLPFSNDR